MVHAGKDSPMINDDDLNIFIDVLSSLPAEEWQKRIVALKRLINSIPDYSTTTTNDDDAVVIVVAPMTPGNGDGNNQQHAQLIPWYRSSTSVRRLVPPLKSLILDARSAVVKDATDLIRTLMLVKLQPHPSLTTATAAVENDGRGAASREEGVSEEDYIGLVNDDVCEEVLETINGHTRDAANTTNNSTIMNQQQLVPLPAFVGRLLLRDLLPFILDMSKQTVKVIRMYGINMTIDILPHCRVKSCLVILLERMKTHQNRTMREDCARYLRCVLETWPLVTSGNNNDSTNDGIFITNSRKDETLSLALTREIGIGLGRTLSDSTHPVREEAKRGFQVLYQRFRSVWDEVMNSGVVRDVRLRKKLMDMASTSSSSSRGGGITDGNLFDDEISLGQMSFNSAISGMSYASQRSYMSHTTASRAMTISNGVPSVIGTPKLGSPRARSRIGQSSNANYNMRDTTGSTATSKGVMEQAKVQAKEASDKYSINKYVTSTGHVLSTPSPRGSPRRKFTKPATNDSALIAEQPFASLMHTPIRPTNVVPKTSAEILRKRLSRRISGIKPELHHHEQHVVHSPSNQLSCVDETEDCEEAPPSPGTATETTKHKDAHTTEITAVALEVILAHMSHLEQLEKFIATEKEILQNLNKDVGITITDMTITSDIEGRLCDLTEEQVCDYFESVHACVNKQRTACEELLREMERISQGTVSTASISDASPSSDIAQSPYGDADSTLQRNLRDEFDA